MDQSPCKWTINSAYKRITYKRIFWLPTNALIAEGTGPGSASFSLRGSVSPDDFLFCVLEKSAHTHNLNTTFTRCFSSLEHTGVWLSCPRQEIHVCAWIAHGNFMALVMAIHFFQTWERFRGSNSKGHSNSLLLQRVSHRRSSPEILFTLLGVTPLSTVGGTSTRVSHRYLVTAACTGYCLAMGTTWETQVTCTIWNPDNVVILR